MGTDSDEVRHLEVQTAVRPTFRFRYTVGEDETEEEARERALENARHDAPLALSETAHEYDWLEVDEED